MPKDHYLRQSLSLSLSLSMRCDLILKGVILVSLLILEISSLKKEACANRLVGVQLSL